MSGEKAQEIAKAPQVYFDKAETATFDGVPKKVSYNLSKRASKVESVICNLIDYTDPVATNLSSNNRVFLERNRNRTVVIRSSEKIGAENTYVVYDAYYLTFEDKGIFTESEPKEVGTWLTIHWKVEYLDEVVRDTNGNVVIDPTTLLPKTTKVPIGLWPPSGTQIVVEYHARKELEPTPTLASNSQFVTLTADIADRVEAGELIVSFTALSGKLLDK